MSERDPKLLPIAKLGDIAESSVCGARVRDVDLVLVRHEGGVRVFEGRCLHQGTLLSEGSLEAGTLVCRAHGWRYSADTGQRLGDAGRCLFRLDTVIEDGQILVDTAAVDACRGHVQARKAPGSPQRSISDLPGPKGLPVLGSLLDFDVQRLHLVLERWSREYGPLCAFKLMGRTFLIVSDHRLIQEILRERPERYRRLSSIDRALVSMDVNGVFSAEGDAWRAQRRLVIRALDREHLRLFFPTFVAVTRRLRRRFQAAARDGRAVDAQKELMRYTVDVTTNLAFGYDMNTLENEDDPIQRHLEHVLPVLNRRVNAPFPYWKYLKLPSDRALDRAMSSVSETIGEFIARAREHLAEPGASGPRVRPRNFLEAMLLAESEESSALNEQQVIGNVFTMLIAGEDTTANSMAWVIHFMCEHPEVQAAMQKEADARLGTTDVLEEIQAADELRTIEAVIHESMRLKPVAPLLFFEPNEDVVLGDLRVPRGTPLLLATRYSCLKEEHFEKAERFDPDRWLSDAASPAPRNAFVPFGAGPRLCPGRGLALLEMKMALSMLCRSFSVRRAPEAPAPDEVFSFTLAPKNLSISLTPRDAAGA